MSLLSALIESLRQGGHHCRDQTFFLCGTLINVTARVTLGLCPMFPLVICIFTHSSKVVGLFESTSLGQTVNYLLSSLIQTANFLFFNITREDQVRCQHCFLQELTKICHQYHPRKQRNESATKEGKKLKSEIYNKEDATVTEVPHLTNTDQGRPRKSASSLINEKGNIALFQTHQLDLFCASAIW